MGLLGAFLSSHLAKLAAPTLSHEAVHALPRLAGERLADDDVVRLAAGLPGPPRQTEWYSAKAPLPDMPLVEAGMRPITGGRRPSF